MQLYLFILLDCRNSGSGAGQDAYGTSGQWNYTGEQNGLYQDLKVFYFSSPLFVLLFFSLFLFCYLEVVCNLVFCSTAKYV